VGHAGFIRNQPSKMPADPQLGQWRQAARQSMRGMDGLDMAKSYRFGGAPPAHAPEPAAFP
jgi:hypothetical protein